MSAEILQIHQENPNERIIAKAVTALNNGDICLVPTDTGYCFVGLLTKAQVQEKLLRLRPGHPKQKPFGILCKDIQQVAEYTYLDTTVFRQVKRLWPGPYTCILPCTKAVSKILGGKRTTVGVRIPAHPVTLKLLQALEEPLFTTSVTDEDELIEQHYFDRHDQTDAWWTQVYEICQNLPPLGHVRLAIENNNIVPIEVSTVIDFSTVPPSLLRDGGWELELSFTGSLK